VHGRRGGTDPGEGSGDGPDLISAILGVPPRCSVTHNVRYARRNTRNGGFPLRVTQPAVAHLKGTRMLPSRSARSSGPRYPVAISRSISLGPIWTCTHRSPLRRRRRNARIRNAAADGGEAGWVTPSAKQSGLSIGESRITTGPLESGDGVPDFSPSFCQFGMSSLIIGDPYEADAPSRHVGPYYS